MSCCPPKPEIRISDAVGYPDASYETEMEPGESLECYAQRSGDQAGKLDDATELVPDKIDNTAVPIDSTTASVNVTFKLTSASTKTPTAWKLKVDAIEVTSFPGPVNFTSNGATATLAGTFATAEHNKLFAIMVEAYDGTELIDARTFRFSPSIRTNTDSIELTVPLPGGIVNSKYGLRLHPIKKVQKLHSGIDMRMPDRSIKDVVAAADGEVTFAGISGTLTSGYGNTVRMKHFNGSGQVLCTTLYAHLATIYVRVGQSVSAGQKVGLIGTTGSSTGIHLHFECRLPNNTPVDPVPYFREGGGTQVADSTEPNGDPKDVQTVPPAGAAMSPNVVAALSADCPGPGVDPLTGQQAAPPPPAPPPPPPANPGEAGDAFEAAWYFTMTWEVGPHWMTAQQFSPGDPELDAGLFETREQRRKVGYKPGPDFPGGETKFGVAQNPNKDRIVVSTLQYAQAKTFGKDNYWNISGSTNCANKAPLIGIMLFDMNYLHGPGNARRMFADSGQAGVPADADRAAQIAACEAIHLEALKFIAALNPKYQNGWRNRAVSRINFIRNINYPELNF